MFTYPHPSRLENPRSLVARILSGAAVIAFGVTNAASVINYGDYDGTSVKYLQVTESSVTDAVPLYGAPTVSADSLSFSPTFSASSGGGGTPDTTDGKLNFDILAKNGTNGPYNTVINKVQFAEGGDFTLAGFSTGGTYVDVNANFTITIQEVDGIAINPFFEQFTMSFLPNFDGTFLLNPGPADSGNWSGSIDIDIVQMLNNKGDAYLFGATRVNVALDNILVAGSEPGTNAFIAKKFIDGLSVTTIAPTNVPEPGSLALVLLGGGLALLRRRR